MVNYQYIIDLFKGILTESNAIEGRFFIGARYGLQETNYDNLGQVVDAVQLVIPGQKKYPLVIMAPPHSTIDFGGHNEDWETFRIILFFMKKTFNNSDNSVAVMNPDTLTSQHAIYQDWHDMKRCVINFVRALLSVQKTQKKFNYPTQQHALIIPLSNIGTDRIAGVRFAFDFRLWVGCQIEDYDEYPTEITISEDSHPEHSY